MKALLIISANLCFIASFAQEKTSTKKNLRITENKQITIIESKEDTLQKNSAFSTKKIPLIYRDEKKESQKHIDSSSNSNIKKSTTSKKII